MSSKGNQNKTERDPIGVDKGVVAQSSQAVGAITTKRVQV
jgi:hypothetical protein